MMIASAEYADIAEVVKALHTPQFTSRLIAWLQAQITFDCAVILGYRQGKHPIYLYDSIPSQRELLFQRYLTDSFLKDPFYQAILDGSAPGVYGLNDVVPVAGEYRDYQQEFYRQTGWQDELCVTIQLDEGRWVVIYLGLLQHGRFSLEGRQRLQHGFRLVEALCHQQWQQQAFVLAEAPLHQPGMASALQAALASFGADRLTQREQEVTALLVQGLDSQEIAESLGIGIGTVKNHRKRVYAQLNVRSLSELFQLFLNHMLAAPWMCDLKEPK
ncbi:helix-turn-helix transcriptional regulator [Vibrio proteolyticus]